MSDRVTNIDRVIAFALEHPWALTDDARTIVAEVLARRVGGDRADSDDIAAAVASRRGHRDRRVALVARRRDWRLHALRRHLGRVGTARDQANADRRGRRV